MNTSAPYLDGLRVLQEREQAERDEAAGRLATAREEAAHAQEQAEQLLRYRDEYGQRWSSQFKQGAPAELVQCYRTFLERLDQAVAQQASLARHAEDRLEVQRLHAQGCEQRLAAVKKLIARRETTWAQAQDRAQQRLGDEIAQRQHTRHASQNSLADAEDAHEHMP